MQVEGDLRVKFGGPAEKEAIRRVQLMTRLNSWMPRSHKCVA